MTARSYDVIIIGAGAAGLMAAIEAGNRGKSVLVLEHNDRIGKKILISGGGRCNFTNLNARAENYLSSQPDFCKSALARYRPSDFIALVEKHQIGYHEKKLGQLFCNGSSRQIVEMLQKECDLARVKIETQTKVVSLKKEEAFFLETNRGAFSARSVVIATGGLSLPKLGASDFAYRIAKQFGIEVVPLQAGLVPLVFAGGDLEFCHELSGLSVDCVAKCDRAEFRENLLFTHRGLSGPAILQISSFWNRNAPISFSLLPGEREPLQWLLENRTRKIQLDHFLAQKWPRRFAEAWCFKMYGEARPLEKYAVEDLQKIAKDLQSWTLRPSETEGYATAEVTRGGVATRELSSKTMESRQVAGLYFVGEAVDVTGWLGGYNFQWAWSSGFAAGQSV